MVGVLLEGVGFVGGGEEGQAEVEGSMDDELVEAHEGGRVGWRWIWVWVGVWVWVWVG